MSGIFTRPRIEQRGASGSYLPVLARVEIDGSTRSFQVMTIQSNQYGRIQIDCALDGTLHVLGIGGGVGEFTLTCIDGPIIDCDIRENSKTLEGALEWANPLTAAGRFFKWAGKQVVKAWTTKVSEDPYKTESPLLFYTKEMDSLKKRCAKIYIYSKFESWRASDTNDSWNSEAANRGKQIGESIGGKTGSGLLTTTAGAIGYTLGGASNLLDSNKQGVTGVFNGIIKDIQVNTSGSGSSDAIMTSITLVGTWTAS